MLVASPEEMDAELEDIVVELLVVYVTQVLGSYGKKALEQLFQHHLV